MTREEYKKIYVDCLVANSEISREDAEENFENGDFGDYTYDPEYAALDEISYWDD